MIISGLILNDMGTKQNKAAGFIVISSDLERVLVLKKKSGEGDLPKGKKDEGEDSFFCAIRETFEETGIAIKAESIIVRTPYPCNGVDFFIAVQDGEPSISPNPVSGNYEHSWVGWLPWVEAHQSVRNYMRPAVTHAMTICKALKGN